MNFHGNREFRKIPSLKFLFEISNDGRIIRNVKSKKQVQIIYELTAIINGKRYSVSDFLNECWPLIKQIRVILAKDTENVVREFNSLTEAAKFLATEYGKSVNILRPRLVQRRKKIYDYSILYFPECRD